MLLGRLGFHPLEALEAVSGRFLATTGQHPSTFQDQPVSILVISKSNRSHLEIFRFFFIILEYLL